MSRPRALTDEEAIAAEQWFSDYERVGSFESKARELRIAPHTLRDAIRRVRGEDTRPLRKKLSEAELSALLDTIPRETAKTSEEQLEGNES